MNTLVSKVLYFYFLILGRLAAVFAVLVAYPAVLVISDLVSIINLGLLNTAKQPLDRHYLDFIMDFSDKISL